MSKKVLTRAGILLALVLAVAARIVIRPSTAHAEAAPVYSISHYVNFTSATTTAETCSKTGQALMRPD